VRAHPTTALSEYPTFEDVATVIFAVSMNIGVCCSELVGLNSGHVPKYGPSLLCYVSLMDIIQINLSSSGTAYSSIIIIVAVDSVTFTSITISSPETASIHLTPSQDNTNETQQNKYTNNCRNCDGNNL